MPHTHDFEEIEAWDVMVCRTCGAQSEFAAVHPPVRGPQRAVRPPLCGMSDCMNRGSWREHPGRFNPNKRVRHFLCDEHDAELLKRHHRYLVEWPSLARIAAQEEAKRDHPSNWPSGPEAFRIWARHPDYCGCRACIYVNGNLDRDDDVRRNAIWT